MSQATTQTIPGTRAGHTPGPWTAKIMRGTIPITGAGGERVAYAYQGESDARLIAAAPMMLEALRGLFAQCVMVHKHWGGSDNKAQADAAIAAARAAIATATGNGGEA